MVRVSTVRTLDSNAKMKIKQNLPGPDIQKRTTFMKKTIGHIQIAGDRTIDDWIQLEKQLVIGGDPAYWKIAATEFFYRRLDTRFLRPIHVLQHELKQAKQGEGFSIVALQCCLIEFIESTAQGRNYRFRKAGEPPLDLTKEYGKSGSIFASFLLEREPFKSCFSGDKIQADEFYSSIRCTVLHEASTRNPWRIWADGPTGKFLDLNRKIVYRNNFQLALEQYIAWYVSELPTSRKFQSGLIEKFKHLCK